MFEYDPEPLGLEDSDLGSSMDVDDLAKFCTNGDSGQACEKRGVDSDHPLIPVDTSFQINENGFESCPTLLPLPPELADLDSQFPELHLAQQTHGLSKVPPDEPVTLTKERFDELNQHMHIPPGTGFGTLGSSAGVDAACNRVNQSDQPPQSVFELNGRHAHLLREALGLAQETVDEASSQPLQMEPVLDRNKRIWLILQEVVGQLQLQQLQQQQLLHQLHQLQLQHQQQQQLQQQHQLQQLQQQQQHQQQQQQLQQHQHQQQQQQQRQRRQRQQRQQQRKQQQQQLGQRRRQQPHSPACAVPLSSSTTSGGSIQQMVLDIHQGPGTITTTTTPTASAVICENKRSPPEKSDLRSESPTPAVTNDEKDNTQVLALHKKDKGRILNALQNVGCPVHYMSSKCKEVGIQSKGLLRVEQYWHQPKAADCKWSSTTLYNGPSRNDNNNSNNSNNNNGLIFLPLYTPSLHRNKGLPVHVIKASYEGGVTLVSYCFIIPSQGWLSYIRQAWEFSSEWNRQDLIDAIEPMTAGLKGNQLAKWLGLKADLVAGTEMTKEDIMDRMKYRDESSDEYWIEEATKQLAGKKRGTKRKKDYDHEEKEKEKEN